MEEKIITIRSEEETRAFGSKLAEKAKPGMVIALIGDLGTGKTTLTKAIAAALGIRGHITSPTFNIQVTYDGGRLPLHHFDLYRLEQEEELDDIGFYDTIESNGASFLEWGDKFPGALPYSYLEIEIRKDEDNPGGRVVFAHAYGDSSRQLLFLWANDSKSRLVKTVK